MGIVSDGKYLYTCNGGNYTIGRINKYTLTGDSITSYPVAIDMRSIMYNSSDGYLYVSGFENNAPGIYRITDLSHGTFVNTLPNLYDNFQSSVAMSDDGQYVYAFDNGTLKQYKLSDGSLVDTFNGLNYGNTSGASGAVAVDADYFYTWDPSAGTVYLYNHEGTYVTSLTLSNGNYGYSLSCFNGYLFVAKDGNYSTGIWYGYNIRRKLSGNPMPNMKLAVQEKAGIPDSKDSTLK
jgi:hypothetical protein